MKRVNKMLVMGALSAAALSLTACANSSVSKEEVTESVSVEASSEGSFDEAAEAVSEDTQKEEKDLYQAFLDGEVPATRITEKGEEYTFMYTELPHDPDDWESYTVSSAIQVLMVRPILSTEIHPMAVGRYTGLISTTVKGKQKTLLPCLQNTGTTRTTNMIRTVTSPSATRRSPWKNTNPL